MALYHKWGVKTGFIFVLQFFMLISDGLGGVHIILVLEIRNLISGKLDTHYIFSGILKF
jgi:hypothetical protein